MVCWDAQGRPDPALASSIDRMLLSQRSNQEVHTDVGNKSRFVILEGDTSRVFYRPESEEFNYSFSIRGDSFAPPMTALNISFPADARRAPIQVQFPLPITAEDGLRPLPMRVGARMDFGPVALEVVEVTEKAGVREITVERTMPAGWRVDLMPAWTDDLRRNRRVVSAKYVRGTDSMGEVQRFTYVTASDFPEPAGLALRPEIWRPVMLGEVPLDPTARTPAPPPPEKEERDLLPDGFRGVRFVGVVRIADAGVSVWNADGKRLAEFEKRFTNAQKGLGPTDVAYGMKHRFLLYKAPAGVNLKTDVYLNYGVGPPVGNLGAAGYRLVPIVTDPARQTGELTLTATEYGERLTKLLGATAGATVESGEATVTFGGFGTQRGSTGEEFGMEDFSPEIPAWPMEVEFKGRRGVTYDLTLSPLGPDWGAARATGDPARIRFTGSSFPRLSGAGEPMKLNRFSSVAPENVSGYTVNLVREWRLRTPRFRLDPR